MSRFLRNKEKEEGITLIALITTIIVLLILAGITIGAITGSNGIIGQAQSAKEETEISQEKEIIDILNLSDKSILKDIIKDLEMKILLRKLDNNHDVLLKYIIDKYKNSVL